MITENVRAYGGLSRYIQGPGILDRLKEYTDIFGKKIFFLIDEFLFDEYAKRVAALYTDVHIEKFAGQITDEKIEAVTAIAAPLGCEAVVGIGGGKAIDLSKELAYKLRVPIIIAPTIASSDAPCSSVSIIYNEDGSEKRKGFHSTNPDLVLVDTAVLVKAPLRFFLAGIGDALSTYYEARANIETNTANYVYAMFGGAYRRTILATAVAEKCLTVIFEDGLKAVNAVKTGALNEAFENVVEVNTLLSGIGFENNACAGAHSIATGMGVAKSKTGMMHGEKVAFGILGQLHIENRPQEEIEELMDLYAQLGLPMTLEDLGLDNDEQTIMAISEASFPCDWASEPVVTTPKIVADGIRLADFWGREYRKRAAV